MANASKRFFGEVGYAPTETDDTGVSVQKIVKRDYYGDVLDVNSHWKDTENLNDDISVSHRISILVDPYAIENFPYIKYVTWLGTRWEVKSTKLDFPRVILSLGGVYNGPTN